LDRKCPKCGSSSIRRTDIPANRIIIDLVKTKNGIRKTIIKYEGCKGYCRKCKKYFSPKQIADIRHTQLYGHKFKSWLIYHRVALRLPYETICKITEELFGEKVLAGSLVGFIKDFAKYYSKSEKSIVEKLLESPYIHADETKMNIYGINWYVWIFTNGEFVVFRLTETREATIVHEFLASFNGILISDFYPGYDSVKCVQQKCWVHLFT